MVDLMGDLVVVGFKGLLMSDPPPMLTSYVPVPPWYFMSFYNAAFVSDLKFPLVKQLQ